MVAGTANGSGQLTLNVEPALDTRVVPAGAVAHFDQPLAVFRQVTEQSELGPIGAGQSLSGGRLNAVQDLRA